MTETQILLMVVPHAVFKVDGIAVESLLFVQLFVEIVLLSLQKEMSLL